METEAADPPPFFPEDFCVEAENVVQNGFKLCRIDIADAETAIAVYLYLVDYFLD